MRIAGTAIAVLLSSTMASAQKRPPTVSVPASELSAASQYQVGLWQLLSHSNSAGMICGGGNAKLSVLKSTGQVVCALPHSSEPDCEPGAAPSMASNDAARQELASAEQEVSRLQSMLDQGAEAFNVAVENMAAANQKTAELQRRADAEQDIQTKIDLLQEQVSIKKAAMDVARQRDKLQQTIDGLESQLKQAMEQAEAARRKLNESSQASPSSCPSETPQKTPGQMALEQELLEQYGGDRNAISNVAENADYASLAAAAYNAGADPGVDGWKRLHTYNYSSKIFGSNTASVFLNSNTNEVVVAFQGTNQMVRDNVTNALSATRLSGLGQANWARDIARQVTKVNAKVTFVGHSLGGRLARLARIETGSKAVVFDSAPLSGADLLQEKVATSQAAALVGFRAPGDVISAQSAIRDIEVKNYVHSNTRQAHSIDQLATAMQTVKQVNSWMDD